MTHLSFLPSQIPSQNTFFYVKSYWGIYRLKSGSDKYLGPLISFNIGTSLLVNEFLSFNKYKILEGKGKVSKLQADKKAVKEYDTFNKTQKIISDFDKEIKKLDKKK